MESMPKFLKEPVTIPKSWVKTYQGLWFAQPYYLIFGAFMGAISVFFGVVFVIIVLVATNFNLLGWTE